MKQIHHPWPIRALTIVLLLALLTGTILSTTAAADEATLSAVDIKVDDRAYDWVEETTETHTYDFTSTSILTYSHDDKLATVSLRTNMIFDGETLSCKEGKTFSFGSAISLGDDYGIRGGDLAFDLKQTGGKLSVGLRLEQAAAKEGKRGIWFSFDGAGQMLITSPESDLRTTVSGVPTEGRLTFRDRVNTLTVLVDDTEIARLAYVENNGAITVLSPEGKVMGHVNTSRAQAAGYFTLYADDLRGSIDNLTFTHTTLTPQKAENVPTVDYSNWVAIDDRDRVTPTNETTGDVREGKEVGVFYFLCQTGDASEIPCDNTLLYNTLGVAGMKEYLDKAQANSYYWAEPYFGYYRNNDAWVQRKHAYMLEAAGVDFIFVDLSNGATYDDALVSLFETWKAIRDEGGSTPDICLMGAGSIGAVWNNVKGYIYSEEGVEKYGDLFYEYKGKPLLMADISKLDAATKAELSERFTIRHTWAWSINGSTWNWLQEYEIDENGNIILSNGSWGHDGNGNREQLALCMGHHPTTSKGRSYVNSQIVYSDDYGFSADSGAGLGFANSFKAVKELDPDILLITGWNEWIAGLDHTKVENFAGSHENPFQFVDQFNTEYSRDGEPMKLRHGDGVGFGDNFYYQMAGYIREFKGWAAAPAASGQTTIDLSDKSSWSGVGPTFTDTANDTEWRHSEGYFTGYTYINGTGRNDLLTAKVSQDAEYLYFTVTTAQDVVISNDSDWMNLYLDIDGDLTNGWEGFDIALNRARDGHYVAVESLADGWDGAHIGQALYSLEGDALTIRLAKSLVGIEGTATELHFKWADNATVDGNVMEFMDRGDTAPNDRYAFRYTCAAGTATDTPAINYKLVDTDGASVALRNESEPLPGATDGTLADQPEIFETLPETEPDTEPVTDPETEPATEPATEPETEPETTPETDPSTEPNSGDEPTTDAPGTDAATEPEKTGGCASLVGVVGCFPILLGAWALVRKKRD